MRYVHELDSQVRFNLHGPESLRFGKSEHVRVSSISKHHTRTIHNMKRNPHGSNRKDTEFEVLFWNPHLRVGNQSSWERFEHVKSHSGVFFDLCRCLVVLTSRNSFPTRFADRS